MVLNPLARPPLSLVERISSRLPDRMQALRVRLGAVPWRTFFVSYQWSGGEVGRGTPTLLKAVEITPSPMVVEGGLKQAPNEMGNEGQGSVRFTRVSPLYTEDELNTLLGGDLPAGEERFIETVHDGRDGVAPQRRTYVQTQTPVRNPTTGEWTFWATLSLDSRERYGERRYWAGE